ncbi:MAG: site-specific integrase [Clostridiales bacterium]|jgi:integrase|nr:site-specific integrase [Clostridiales bacterium]
METAERFDRLIAAIEKLAGALDRGALFCVPATVSPQAVAPAPSGRTLYAWFDEYLATYKAPAIKPATLAAAVRTVRVHVKPNIPDMPLEAVAGSDVQRALNAIPGTRLRKSAYHIFNGSFKKAARLGLIALNPMNAVEPARHVSKPGRALTREQQAHFLAALKGNRLKPLYEFYLLTGCRRAEALAVAWDDVDRAAGRVRIQGTKTANAARYIPLFPALAELLGGLPKRGGKVFAATLNAVTCNFRRLKRKYGLTFRIHDLRHTFATRCLECGIALNAVQKWLGHSRPSTTADIYQHVLTDFEKSEAAKFNPAFAL